MRNFVRQTWRRRATVAIVALAALLVAGAAPRANATLLVSTDNGVAAYTDAGAFTKLVVAGSGHAYTGVWAVPLQHYAVGSAGLVKLRNDGNGIKQTLVSAGTFISPQGMAVDQANGNLWVATGNLNAGNGNPEVRVYPSTGGTTFTSITNSLKPMGIANDPTGNLMYVAWDADPSDPSGYVYAYNHNGTVARPGISVGSGSGGVPKDLKVSKDGSSVYIVNAGQASGPTVPADIERWHWNGSSWDTSTVVSVANAFGVAIDDQGKVFVGTTTGALYKFNADLTGQSTVVASGFGPNAQYMAWTPEPGTWTMLAIGLGALARRRRRRPEKK